MQDINFKYISKCAVVHVENDIHYPEGNARMNLTRVFKEGSIVPTNLLGVINNMCALPIVAGFKACDYNSGLVWSINLIYSLVAVLGYISNRSTVKLVCGLWGRTLQSI
jgi:hypothetical protein